ncbi:transcriptional regulator, LysR family [Nocardia nova SH22a]|uniref:Transcriptional regulator, LysR family n=1 Tax=Nocardia nova SH22a TaxID=1415166 RepID=W5TKE9_9NOCA|nr:LysR family transcriptional regulator [Nocardia nova]AHH19840.1 transcriptional regulator, LysR family [Nocardia nova SH22a]
MASLRPSADDLLVFLEVAHSGRFTRAAERLGLNHVTISRRIATLERALGGKLLLRQPGGWELTPLGERVLSAAERLDGVLRGLEAETRSDSGIEDVVRMSVPAAFSTYVAARAAARVTGQHPGVRVEIVSVVKRPAQHRSGVDIEVVVTRPPAGSAEVVRLGSYIHALYASREYLLRHQVPAKIDDLVEHRLVYYISSMLEVDDMHIERTRLPAMRESVTSTNVFAHIDATRAGAGIGLLATFMAAGYDDLVRVLPDEVGVPLEYWLIVRPEALRRPAVAAVVAELQRGTRALERRVLQEHVAPAADRDISIRM